MYYYVYGPILIYRHMESELSDFVWLECYPQVKIFIQVYNASIDVSVSKSAQKNKKRREKKKQKETATPDVIKDEESVIKDEPTPVVEELNPIEQIKQKIEEAKLTKVSLLVSSLVCMLKVGKMCEAQFLQSIDFSIQLQYLRV